MLEHVQILKRTLGLVILYYMCTRAKDTRAFSTIIKNIEFGYIILNVYTN